MRHIEPMTRPRLANVGSYFDLSNEDRQFVLGQLETGVLVLADLATLKSEKRQQAQTPNT